MSDAAPALRGRLPATLRREHHLTVEQYKALLAHQRGGCAVCGREGEEHYSGGRPRRFVFYFSRVGGERIRLLLCRRCNRGYRAFRDSPLLISRALACLALGEAMTRFEAIDGKPIPPENPSVEAPRAQARGASLSVDDD